MPELTLSEWEAFLSQYPDAHLLQTGPWGELKAAFGWEVVRLTSGDAPDCAGAQVLFRSLPLGFRFAYIPKGPVGPAWDRLWPEIDAICRRRQAVFLKVEPDLWEAPALEGGPAAGNDAPPGVERGWQPPGAERSTEPAQLFPPAMPAPPGFRRGLHSIQPARTLVVDLSGDEERVLNRMKQKTRYNIRLALKKGVVVRPYTDLETFQRLMEITSGRDGFGVHSLAYYRRAYELFFSRGECELLVAEYAGEPLASLMVFAHGRRAWYFYGASGNEQRERMPTYLLQWEAIRWARSRGCLEYDLWGVPDADEDTLEAYFAARVGGLWGVYRFKRGFGGELRRSAGPWDRIYRPMLYALYSWWVGRKERDK